MNATPQIFTLTGNLLAERTLEFDAWSPGRTQRAVAETFQVGGKGINVSKMLTRLGVPNTALCFVGGATGGECEAWLRARGAAYRAFASASPTRAGTVVRDRSGAQAETTFLGPDAAPDRAAVDACATFLDAQPAGGVLALCGSFPGWSGADFDPLRATLARWRQRGHLVADTYGPPLTSLVSEPLALLKINVDERRSLPAAHHHALPSAIRRWVITDGLRALTWHDADGREGSVTPPGVREVSPTGSGDVLLACLIEALFVRSLPLPGALEFAIPHAAANAAHSGVADFPLPPARA